MAYFTRQSRMYCFLMVATGVFLTTLDSSMINVALPQIMAAFDEGLERVDMVVIAYLLVISASLVFWGRLGDTVGKGKVYVGGVLFFGLGAACCSLSQTLYQLIAARVFQAFGAAMMMAAGPALIKFVFPKESIGKALGFIGIATSLGLTCGPAVSGFLLSTLTWRSIFLIHLPVCFLIVVSAIILVLPKLVGKEKSHPFPFDWAGGLVWLLLVLSYVYFIRLTGKDLIKSLLVAVFCVVLTVVFIFVEKRVNKPILPIYLAHKRYFWTATVAAALSFCSLFIVIILIPFYLTSILHYSPGSIGVTMMALPISLVFFSPFSGWLYDKVGSARYLSTVGLIISVVGVLMLLGLKSTSTQVYISLCLAVIGCGISIFLTPNSASVLNRVRQRYAGISAGILATARNFGMMSGAAIAGAGLPLAYRLTSGGEKYISGDIVAQHFMVALRSVFVLSVVLLLIGSLLSLSREGGRAEEDKPA